MKCLHRVGNGGIMWPDKTPQEIEENLDYSTGCYKDDSQLKLVNILFKKKKIFFLSQSLVQVGLELAL